MSVNRIGNNEYVMWRRTLVTQVRGLIHIDTVHLTSHGLQQS